MTFWKLYNQLFSISDDQLFVGFLTRTRLRQLLNDGDISQHDQSIFYRSVRTFYERAMEYALQNLPLEDELLQNAAFVNFHIRECATFQQVEYFVERQVDTSCWFLLGTYV